MAIALPVLGERPGLRRVVAGLVGVVGVALLVLRAGGELSTLGLVAAIGSVLVSALGFVLVKRWPAPTDMLTAVSWQLVAGGLALVPVALLLEGPPPTLTVTNVGGLLWPLQSPNCGRTAGSRSADLQFGRNCAGTGTPRSVRRRPVSVKRCPGCTR
jgi:hypothetical protein